ncbi:MAG: choice-of-anchor D domain-containing protein, partial [Kitasatospora sp.]|nr:choice-of-anchor D domain-containing protein [Kitasatospora sp.]
MRSLIRRAVMLAGAVAVLVGSGTGIAAARQVPHLVITPDPGDFGNVPVGGTETRTFTLANTGGSATGNLTITVSPSPPYTITGTTCRGALPPRQSCMVTVRFAPAKPVTATATLTAAGTKPEARAAVVLHGTTRPPKAVTINLVNINDFHGTIDQNTVKWAGTVEQAKALDGATPANTLFLGAGDNVGASTFASSIQQ